MLQDVAYGAEKIKFDNWQNDIIPKAFSTILYSCVTAFYKQNCIDIGYGPLRDSTLWLILKILKPLQRKSLTGLDDTVTAGIIGFEVLNNIAKEEYVKIKNYTLTIDSRLRPHLKTVYQSNCSRDYKIALHNCLFVFSNSRESFFQHKFEEILNDICVEWFELFKALQETSNITRATETTGEDIWGDVDNAVKDTLDYMKYLACDVQQRKAKTSCFNSLWEDTAFRLKHFPEAILCQISRQNDYFRKKRMTLHANIFFHKGIRFFGSTFTYIYHCD